MKTFIALILALSSTVAVATSSPNRTVNAKFLKNGAALVTVPTSTSSLATLTLAEILTNKSIDASTNTLTNIANASISASAAIARTKIASGTANQVIVNDGSGVLSGISSGTSGNLLTSNGTSWASVAPPFTSAVSTKTANYTVLVSDNLLLADTSGGAFTFTLFTAVGNTGKVIYFKKTTSDFTAATIDGDGSETIDGSLTTTIDTQYETVALVSDGTNWQITQRKIPSVFVAYTPTIGATTTPPTKGTVTEVSYWRRVGDSLEWQYSLVQTVAGSAGSGTYLWPLPGGLSIDTAKIITSTTIHNSLGGFAAIAANSDASTAEGIVYNYDVNNLGLARGTIGNPVGSGNFGLDNGTVKYHFFARVPISGWKGN